VVVFAIVAAAWPSLAGAQGQSQGRGRGGGQPEKTAPAATVTASVVFRDTDRATFHNYFTTHKIVPQSLPPGIAKNVARGKPLPPGIAKKAVPADLVALGPRLDKDTSLAIVGEVVVALKGGVVIDVLAGVFGK
jgi:hypothetical protein